MKVKICVAGATGKMGKHLVRAIAESEDLQVVSGIARNYNNRSLKEALGIPGVDGPIYDDVVFALKAKPDVLIDFTSAEIVKRNVLVAIQEKIHVVIGTSGLTEQDLNEIDSEAKKAGVGVICAGNFSITAALMMQFAALAGRYLPDWEIVEYAYEGKPDAPSGTARELAERMATLRKKQKSKTKETVIGIPESRGAVVQNSHIHSVRLPGFNNSCEIIFGTGAERLKIRHDAIDPTKPYIDGALLALRVVSGHIGLRRGLESIMQDIRVEL